jgi:putative RNA 2'-phosphotransferase
MEEQYVRTSRYLSYLLRHHPEAEGLSMDEHGWIRVADLLESPGAMQRGITCTTLAHVVAENDKQRFEFSEDKQRIRARQGHSRRVESDWNIATPPEFLYHGTVASAVSSIREVGLRKRSRQHVHLSPDAASAMKVGARHGRPVVLMIRAQEMHAKGYEFFVTGNGIWLTETVPPEFIYFP